eukprot:jgi/Astpho2/287/fgenesh1_pg.00010_%23_49_t
MLDHTLLPAVERLEGPYQQAFSRICNQVAGSDWKMSVLGEAAPEEPRFSTWEDVKAKRKASGQSAQESMGGEAPGASSSGAAASSSAAGASQPSSQRGLRGVADAAFYKLLGIHPGAEQAEVKSAYRRRALEVHPDVSSASDANERFAEISNAYDTLSDPVSRQLYDEYGPEGMQRHAGAASGQGNAREAWDEFKPFTRTNKHTQARDAAGNTAGMDGGARLPEAGDVVEYPLSEHVQRELMDGRTHGVGLLVGRNIDRGDAKKLPPSALPMCEVEPLRLEAEGSDRWIPDELGVASFAELSTLKVIPVSGYDRRHDVWCINAPLSEGCGSPELVEEVMV